MRVVMISKACIVGTYQRKLEELARLPSLDLTVVVPPFWRDRRGTTVLERVHTDGYDLRVVPMLLNGQYHLHCYPGLGKLVRGLEPDLLHIDEEPYNLATWQAMRLAASMRIPALFFTWQNIHRHYPPPFRWFERYNFGHAACAIAGNREAVDVLRYKGYVGDVHVVPQFGVDPELFSPAHAEPGDDGGQFVIGYAGGLVPEKGVDLLLEAVAGIEHPATSVVIAGEGADEPRLRNLTERLSLVQRVQFVGRIPSPGMPEFYRSLSVLVLPSVAQANWKEQFGRVLVEAMACGVPVVGSDSGEIPHVIGEAGLVFPERDVAALQGCLRRLASDRGLRAQLGVEGRRRVLERYTQRHVAEATYAVYQTVVR